MAKTPSAQRRGPIIGVDVRLGHGGYYLVLRREERAEPVRDGRLVRRWLDLDHALNFLVTHYGGLPIRLQLRGTKRAAKGY